MSLLYYFYTIEAHYKFYHSLFIYPIKPTIPKNNEINPKPIDTNPNEFPKLKVAIPKAIARILKIIVYINNNDESNILISFDIQS